VRLERRPSLINLRRLEPSRGKRFGEIKILGRWSRWMSFKMRSSRKRERENLLGGIARKSKGRIWDSLPKCH